MDRLPAVTRRRFLASAGATVAIGGTVSGSSSGGYTRKYEPLEDPRVDIGAVYIPFLGSKWGKCAKDEPAVGQYDMTDSFAVNRHVDQMQGFGISTAMYNYNGVESQNSQFHNFTDAELVSEIDVECFYILSHTLKWNLDRDSLAAALREDFSFVRDQFLKPGYVSTHDGRPVVTFWGVDYLAWGGNETSREVKERVFDEWGGYAGFVDFIRSELTVGGTEPYLVGEFRDSYRTNPPEMRELNRQFDAGTTWTGLLRNNETVPWEEARTYAENNYRATRAFTEEHDMDFIPMVFPGFDDRHNECWGHDRHVPRSVSHLTELLELADEYRTTDRINLATFNDWTEGHQVEPGRFDGTDYGTAYLEAIEEFQKTPPTTSTTTTTTPSTTTTTSPSTTSTTSSPTTSTEPTTTTTSTVSANAVESTTSSVDSFTDGPTTGSGTTRSSSRTTVSNDTEQSRTAVPGFDILTGLAGTALGLQQYLSSKE